MGVTGKKSVILRSMVHKTTYMYMYVLYFDLYGCTCVHECCFISCAYLKADLISRVVPSKCACFIYYTMSYTWTTLDTMYTVYYVIFEILMCPCIGRYNNYYNYENII
jgi:hypothetical protein